jgi:ABC-type Fe3+/spermidine/putrescine transport system ATPase subunit
VRPEKIKFEEVGEPASLVTATVADVVYVGSMTAYVIDLPIGGQLTVHRLNDELRGRQRAVAIGDRVTLSWAAESSFVIGAADQETERAIEEGIEAQIEDLGAEAAS